jgi:hypothetical protein
LSHNMIDARAVLEVEVHRLCPRQG